MLDMRGLKGHGWGVVRNVKSQAELLMLAGSLGRPIASPSGDFVKEIRPTSYENARKGTLSATYSTGPFPLHTDTAFWPVPARYVVLRTRGDIRRDTTLLKFQDILSAGPPELTTLVDRSIWVVRTAQRRFYCSMRFRMGNAAGLRYDAQCMIPANDAAVNVRRTWSAALRNSCAQCIQWSNDMAIVLCNWEVLHGRGPAPPNETERILERIYVE
jgi:hypothetical protein